MTVTWDNLLLALEFVNRGYLGQHQAFLCKESGKIYYYDDNADPYADQGLPFDINDEEKYLAIPNKQQLDLSRSVALDFARQFLANDFDLVRRIFSKGGGYRKFKALLVRRRALDRWHEFETRAAQKALRQWCADSSVEIADSSDQ
jgi:hypothetical protein